MISQQKLLYFYFLFFIFQKEDSYLCYEFSFDLDLVFRFLTSKISYLGSGQVSNRFFYYFIIKVNDFTFIMYVSFDML